tara:strand:- start:1277 stop:1660 length:384 start_codon:yes stop_codon:yes gene_type:complete
MEHWKKLNNLFWYSDSEPNELLIAFCYILVLPACIIEESSNPNLLLLIGGILIGLYQLGAVIYSVLFSGCLKYRLIATKLSSILGITIVVNLFIEGTMKGTNFEWMIITLFAFWNTLRLFKEKLERD